MNGELPMIAPVSGWRSGAPGGATSRARKTTTPIRPQNAKRSPRVSSADISRALDRMLALVPSEPRLDDPVGDQRDDDAS